MAVGGPRVPDDVTVSVGVPVRNAGDRLATALRSLLAQDHEALRVVVSDNASTDDTVDVYRAVVGDDPRFELVRHEQDRGWQANFRYVLDRAETPWFMWLAADDAIAPTFVSATLAMLRADPRMVTAVPRVAWTGPHATTPTASGTRPLVATPRRNVAAYLRHARDNSRFYGLHRREALVRSMPVEDFYGLDLAIMAGTLRFGTHGEVPEVLLQRERTDPAGYARHIAADARSGLDLVLPLWRLTRCLVLELRVPLSPSAVWWLSVRNVYEHLRHWSRRPGVWGRAARVGFALLDRRRARVVASDDARSGQSTRRR